MEFFDDWKDELVSVIAPTPAVAPSLAGTDAVDVPGATAVPPSDGGDEPKRHEPHHHRHHLRLGQHWVPGMVLFGRGQDDAGPTDVTIRRALSIRRTSTVRRGAGRKGPGAAGVQRIVAAPLSPLPPAYDRVRVLIFDRPESPYMCRVLKFYSLLEAAPQLRVPAGVKVWVDVHEPTVEDTRVMTQRFNLHRVSALGILSDIQAERIEAYDQYAQLAMDVTVHKFGVDSAVARDPKQYGYIGSEDPEDPNQYGRVVTFVFFRHLLFTFHRRALVAVRKSMAEYESFVVATKSTSDLAAARSGGATLGGADEVGGDGGEDNSTAEIRSMGGGGTSGDLGPGSAGKRDPAAAAATPGPALFLHDILRHFIVDCETLLASAEEAIEVMQEQALEMSQKERPDMMRRINVARQDLMDLQRRLLRKRLILRDAVTGRAATFVTAGAHALVHRAAEEIDELARDLVGLKDGLNNVQSNYLSKISSDMAAVAQLSTESIKVFAIATTLAIPITGIGGILGMNIYYPNIIGFEAPGLPPSLPFVIAIITMASLSLFMLFVFWRAGLLIFPRLFH